MKKIILFLLLCTVSVVDYAQENEVNFTADRPGASTGPDVLDFKQVLWETGFEGYYAGTYNVVLPTTMFRFGITKFAELRLEYDGVLAQLEENPRDWKYEVLPLTIGTKVKVFEGYKWIPKISLMANLAIPLTKAQFSEYHVAPSVHLLFQNNVTDWFNIGYDVGADWDGISAIPATFLAVSLGFNITENLGAYIESYNYFVKYGIRNTEAECNLDFGFSYQVHPRVQLDIYGAFNCQDPKSFACIGLGVAWMIH